MSDKDHTQVYKIVAVEGDVFPGKFGNYHGRLHFKRITDGNRTFGEWEATFDGEPETADAVAKFIGENIFLGSLKKI